MASSERQFQDGELIFREGDSSHSAYVLLDGVVELTKEGEVGTVTLATLRTGEVFGEMGLFDQSPRSTSARAAGAVTVRVVPREEFLASLKHDPDAALQIIAKLVERLRATNEMLVRGIGASAAREPRERRRGRLGFLDRLLGIRRRGPIAENRPERIEVRLAPIAGDIEKINVRHLEAVFETRPWWRIKVLRNPLEVEATGDPVSRLLATATAARAALAAEQADLLIWSEIGESGTTVALRFVPALPEDEDRPGCFGQIAALELPVSFGPEFGEVLQAVALAAVTPANNGKTLTLREALPKAVEAALPVVRQLPGDLTSRERATVQGCFATAAALVARQSGSAELYQIAAQNYQAALETITAQEWPIEWAMLQRNLGVVLQILAEAARDVEILRKSAESYANALTVLNRPQFPREWAAMHGRLGIVIYKLDPGSGDDVALREALTHFQAALQVYTRADAPMRWAEVMNNIGQVAQMLGGQMRNPEVVEKAAEACRGALEVRTRDRTPLLWAASQNNLGSALFLLAKLTRDPKHLEAAAEAFRQAHALYITYGAQRMIAITEKNLSHVQRLIESHTPRRPPPRNAWEEAIAEDDGEPAPVESEGER